MPEKPRMQLGKLPPEPDRPALYLRTLAVPVPTLPLPLPEVHNIELVPDKDPLGNDMYGNCVFVMIENNRRIAAAALGVPIVRLTAQQVIDKYTLYTGVKTPPGPGAVIQRALEWVRSATAGWGGNHLLAFARAPITELAIRQANSEFQSCGFGVEIHSGQVYPSKVWDYRVNDPYQGGHAVAGGTYSTLADFCKTWGYMAQMTPAYVAHDMDEVSVLIWDFQWESLSYERQTTLIADYQALTGKAWTGPIPIQLTQPRSAMNYTAIPPVRLLDTRSNVGLTGPFAVHVARKLQVAGVAGIPPTAVAICANLTVTQQNSGGFLAAGPDLLNNPTTSSLNFPIGDDRANALPGTALNVDGSLAITFVAPVAGKTAHVILDVNGYFEP
jgi:hypothetical protein